MNKIFSLILCFSLVIGPVTVHAEQFDIDNSKSDAYKADGGTGGDKGIGFYMKQAGMLAFSVTGMGMVTCNGWSYHWSHYVFAAGGAVYIVGEIAMANDKTDYLKTKKEELKIDDTKLAASTASGGGKKDVQTQALQAALDNEINNKKMMERRKDWATAVAIIYDLAAISAGVEFGLSLFPVYTGFEPDFLLCSALPAIAVPTAATLGMIYSVGQAVDQSNGNLGLDTVAFMALLQTEVLTIASAAGPLVTTGVPRTIYFAAAAVLANVVVDGLKDRIDIAQGNIDKLSNALCTWGITPAEFTCPSTTGGAAGAAGGGGAGGYVPPVASGGGGTGVTKPTSNYMATLGKFPNTRNNCLGRTSSGGVQSSPSACGNPLKFTTAQPNKLEIPDLASLNQTAFTYADELAKGPTGDKGKIATAGNNLLANAARIRALKEQTLNDMNAKLKIKDPNAKDLRASIADRYKDMMKSLAASGAKTGLGSGSAKLATLDPEESTKPAVKPVVVAPKSGGAGGVVPSLSIPSSDLGLTTDATGLTVSEQNALTSDYEKNKGAYLSTENDSLFQVLSKTYIRNLDRILVRKKSLEEVKPVEKPEE